MPWMKYGRVYAPDSPSPWMRTHAQLPTPLLLEDTIRVYVMTRDEGNRSRVGAVDLDKNNPSTVIRVHPDPCLDLGTRGAFDDNGVAPSCALVVDGKVHLYYVGISPRVTVPLSYAIGLATSEDGGATFRRLFPGPIVDRCPEEGFLFTSPFVVKAGQEWRMYYTCGTGWHTFEDRKEMLYEVRCCRSADGMSWKRPGITCIAPANPLEVTARPWVVRDGDLWRMWYCYRGTYDFRDGKESYRIGYAESDDGLSWTRLDHVRGVLPSADGWDSTMIAYPAIVDVNGRRLLFYNGNGFGSTGFGYAEWTDG